MRRLPHYSFDALLPFIDAAWRPESDTAPGKPLGPSGRAAVVLGVDPNTAQHWRRAGLREPTADRMAVRLGYHPSLIWPEWWEGAT